MKVRKWDFRNLPSGEPVISNVVCENSLTIIYFQFIWRWSRDSVLGGRSSLPQTRKVKNIMFETSGNIFAYRMQYITSGNENCTFELLYNNVNVGFLYFSQLTQLKNGFMALIECICVKKMTPLNPSALTVWTEKLRGWKKNPHIQVILGLTKTAKFVEIYCPLVNMCSVLLVYYSLIFLRLNTSPRTVVVQGHSQLTSLIHLNPRPKLNEATVPGAWIYYQ